MKLALRGIMDRDGDIHSWPTLAMTHNDFFAQLYGIDECLRARWRQWDADDPVDFDPGVTPEDRALVEAYVKVAQR